MKHRVNSKQIDRERDQIEQDRACGLLSREQYAEAMREIDRDERDAYREAAELNAEDAYRDTMSGDF